MRDFLFERSPEVRRVTLFAMVAGVPVFFLRIANDPFNVPKLAILIVGIGVVGSLRAAELLQGVSRRGLSLLLVPALAIVGPLALSWAFSSYRAFALIGHYGRFQGLVPYLAIVVFGILVADAFRDEPIRLAKAVVWSGAIVGLYAVIQVVGLDPFQWDVRGITNPAISTIGNPNFTGGFLGVVLPVGVAYWLVDVPERKTIVRLLILIILGLGAARSEGGFAAAVAGTAIVAGAFLRPRWRFWKAAGFLVVGAICAGIISVVVLSLVAPDSIFGFTASITRGRWWVAAGRMMLESPFFGEGPNTFAFQGVEHRVLADAIEYRYDFPDDPHSVPMSFFANAGLVGGIGFFVAAAWTVRTVWKLDPEDILRFGFGGAAIGYFVQSLVSIDEVSLRLALWVALAGLVSAAPVTAKKRSTKKKVAPAKKRAGAARTGHQGDRLRSLPLVAFSGLVGVAIAVYGFAFLVADVRVRRALGLFQQGNGVAASREIEAATGSGNRAQYQGIYAFQLKSVALRVGSEAEPLVDQADKVFSEYLGESPYVFGIVNHAQLLDQWGEEDDEDRDEEAYERYLRALRIDPLNPSIRSETASLLIEMERAGDAVILLEPAQDELQGVAPDFWGVLALARAEVGDTAGAADALEIALSLDPAEPNALKAQDLLQDKGR